MESNWAEDNKFDRDNNGDNGVFEQRDEVVEEQAEKETRPIKNVGNVTGICFHCVIKILYDLLFQTCGKDPPDGLIAITEHKS